MGSAGRADRARFALAIGAFALSLPTPLPGQAEDAARFLADSVRIQADGAELRGMLRVPAGAGAGADARVPAVLLLPGGGTQYLTWEPDYFAGRLADVGIATLVVHKRGTGDSGGDWATATFETLLDDAGAAIAFLREDPRVDPGRVGVMGFSQGGRFAPVVAARHDLAAAVGISGPAISAGETRLYALRHALAEAGLPRDRLEEAMGLWREFVERTAAGESTDPLDDRIRDAATRMTPQALPPTSSAATPSPVFNSLPWDGADDLRRLRAPFLAMYGELDPTTPVAASVAALRVAFADSGYEGFNLLVIPGSAHGLNDETGERHVLYETVPVAWLAAHLTSRGAPPSPPR